MNHSRDDKSIRPNARRRKVNMLIVALTETKIHVESRRTKTDVVHVPSRNRVNRFINCNQRIERITHGWCPSPFLQIRATVGCLHATETVSAKSSSTIRAATLSEGCLLPPGFLRSQPGAKMPRSVYVPLFLAPERRLCRFRHGPKIDLNPASPTSSPNRNTPSHFSAANYADFLDKRYASEVKTERKKVSLKK